MKTQRTVAQRARNHYVVIPPRSSEEVPWNPCDAQDLPVPDCAYLGPALAAMEHQTSIRGLTFYITSNIDRLPSYGDSVVVLLISDEWCRIPRYVFDVRAIFKTYGTDLAVHWGALVHPTLYDLCALVQDLRTMLRRLPSVIRALRTYAGRLLRAKPPRARVYTIPLGYFRQLPIPFVEIAKRRFDVYFAGSVKNNDASSRPFSRLTPKYLSRAIMLDRLRGLSARHPELTIVTTVTTSFLGTTDDDVTQYSKAMMETRICLVPRGTSLETYRYFEGLRFGCVVIAERLPRRPFYDGAPAIRVRSWAEIEQIIPAVLSDAGRLERLSRASLDWWSTHCSAEALGAYLATRLPAD